MLQRFPRRVGLTLFLVVLEAAATLLFPLVIGVAVDDLLRGTSRGLVGLGALSLAALIVGSARRFYDTRAYSEIYAVLATELAETEYERGTPVSTIAARTSLLTELVEFLENSMPLIVHGLIGIVGTLVILAGIDIRIWLAALGLALWVVATYACTASLNLRLTTGYNDELEAQVAALETREVPTAGGHFGRLMRWNRRLSDLETLNYFAIYVGVIALMIYAPLVLVGLPDPRYGIVLAALMYVFEFIEAVLQMPLFLQQGIRLREIASRL